MRRITLDIWSHVPAGKPENAAVWQCGSRTHLWGYGAYRNVAEMVKASDVMRSRRFDSCRSDVVRESTS